MKLQWYKLYDKDENITDVYHVAAKDNKEVYTMLDSHMESIKNAGLSDTYCSYRFFEVYDVGGYRVDLTR